MFLREILKAKREYLQREEKKLEEYKELYERGEKEGKLPQLRDFTQALRQKKRYIPFIGEIKVASPTAGRLIPKEKDPLYIAQEYALYGASAISVVTEEKFFLGNFNILAKIKNNLNLPILCKDFILDEREVYKSRIYGADAILLIVAAVPQVDKLSKLIEVAKRVGLVAVVEVHSEGELDIALKLENYEVILINNRNLYTFEVDVSNAIRLKLRIPKNRLIIAASGINTREEVILLKERGMDALLLGEVLLTSHNIGTTLRELNLR